MKVSLNTIQSLIDFELPPVDELVHRINQQLGGVEEVIDLGAKYKDVVIVRVVSAVKHENADKLNVCMVDDGGVVADVERDHNGHVQVVCGAPNVHDDMFAAWLPPKSTVPSSYDDVEPFVLESRELRGVISNGMLASAKELAIGTDHDGIVEIDPAEAHPSGIEIVPGTSFAEAYGLDDTIIDIENKMFTHRPDCFGQLGVAREISAILQPAPSRTVHSEPSIMEIDWFWRLVEFKDAAGLEIDVFNDADERVPRFMAVAISGIEVRPSPLWMQIELVRWGGKPINNIVDLTNYMMLLTAQPTHAYDYDKLRGARIGARMAHEGETVTLLNGKTYELGLDDIVIADGDGVIGLGGIMGGAESEVSIDTKNIVLEVANFDMYTLRRTSMKYGLFTDAVTRFNKGQSVLQADRVLARLMQLIGELAGGTQASPVNDLNDFDGDIDKMSLHGEMLIRPSFINQRLGLNLNDVEIGNILRAANFAVFRPGEDDDELSVTAPFWRTDIELPEDVVEEVGRLYGFDKLPRELPLRSVKPAGVDPRVQLNAQLRQHFSRAGANEVMTYSFVHEKILKNSGQNPDAAFRLSNALSPELQYYRLSLVPSLLDKVHMNIKAGHDEFTLFEVGKGHHKDELEDEGVPKEFERIAAVYASKKPGKGAPYYHMRELVDLVAREMNFDVYFAKLSDFDFTEHDMMRQMCAPFEPQRSAIVMHGEQFGGVVGELRQSVIKSFKLPDHSAACELFISLFEKNSTGVQYRPLSRFPSITQDVSLKVSSETPYQSLASLASNAAMTNVPDLDVVISPVSIYQSEEDPSTKTITLRIKVTSHERTLEEDEATNLTDAIAQAAGQKLSATRV